MICLTFDSDHLDDQRMEEWVSQVDIPGRATMYCTDVYESLRDHNFEIGPHPFLGDGTVVDVEIQRYREMFPKARTWRSHSLVFSQVLAWKLADLGYSSVSTHEAYFEDGLKPNFNTWGVWQFPIFYMDNADFDRARRYSKFSPPVFDKSTIDRIVNGAGLYVADMHPIHIMLNTPSLDYYMGVRDDFRANKPIEPLRYSGYGAGDFFTDLLSEMRRQNKESISISDALETYAGQIEYQRED